MAVKGASDLLSDLNQAKKEIKVGGRYAHYKHPDRFYTVVDLAIQEATEKVCVIYRAEYEPFLTFVRDFGVWSEKVEVDGALVDRFKLA